MRQPDSDQRFRIGTVPANQMSYNITEYCKSSQHSRSAVEMGSILDSIVFLCASTCSPPHSLRKVRPVSFSSLPHPYTTILYFFTCCTCPPRTRPALTIDEVRCLQHCTVHDRPREPQDYLAARAKGLLKFGTTRTSTRHVVTRM